MFFSLLSHFKDEPRGKQTKWSNVDHGKHWQCKAVVPQLTYSLAVYHQSNTCAVHSDVACQFQGMLLALKTPRITKT